MYLGLAEAEDVGGSALTNSVEVDGAGNILLVGVAGISVSFLEGRPSGAAGREMTTNLPVDQVLVASLLSLGVFHDG